MLFISLFSLDDYMLGNIEHTHHLASAFLKREFLKFKLRVGMSFALVRAPLARRDLSCILQKR